MKTLVIYYSYTGTTRTLATRISQDEKADLVEVRDAAPRSTFNAYVFGSFEAMRKTKANLLPITINFGDYDNIIIAMPIWAGYPAPAIHNIIDMLPSGKSIALMMCSKSGNSKRSQEEIKALIAAKGCTVVDYQNIKA